MHTSISPPPATCCATEFSSKTINPFRPPLTELHGAAAQPARANKSKLASEDFKLMEGRRRPVFMPAKLPSGRRQSPNRSAVAALELSESAGNGEHHAPTRGGGVDAFGEGPEPHSPVGQVGDGGEEMDQ